jgi:hypothetical protein
MQRAGEMEMSHQPYSCLENSAMTKKELANEFRESMEECDKYDQQAIGIEDRYAVLVTVIKRLSWFLAQTIEMLPEDAVASRSMSEAWEAYQKEAREYRQSQGIVLPGVDTPK